MNQIAIIILLTLIIDLILHLISDYLNIKSARKKIPKQLTDIYTEKDYKKSQRYLITNTKFSWLISIINLLIFITFWFGKGFPFLDSIVRAWDFNPVASGLFYVGILSIAKLFISIPFKVYSIFIIEEKFGFNKTTLKTFVFDLIKSLILTIIIGGIVLSAVFIFFEYIGQNAWLYCWITVVTFMFIIQYIVPTWIMPLFNKFTPLEEGELKKAVIDYAKSINFSLKNIFVMDGSKRSTKSNAFFTGFGKNKRIVLFDTLIAKHTTPELLAILAHEMGHFKKKHILKNLVISILHTGCMLFLLSLFISYQGLFDAFYMPNRSIYAGLIFFSMLYSPVEFLLGIILQIFSRKNEYEADRFTVETTGKAKPMISALKKLSANNLSNLTPHPLYVFLNYSHPPLLKRINAIKNHKK